LLSIFWRDNCCSLIGRIIDPARLYINLLYRSRKLSWTPLVTAFVSFTKEELEKMLDLFFGKNMISLALPMLLNEKFCLKLCLHNGVLGRFE